VFTVPDGVVVKDFLFLDTTPVVLKIQNK